MSFSEKKRREYLYGTTGVLSLGGLLLTSLLEQLPPCPLVPVCTITSTSCLDLQGHAKVSECKVVSPARDMYDIPTLTSIHTSVRWLLERTPVVNKMAVDTLDGLVKGWLETTVFLEIASRRHECHDPNAVIR